MDLCCTRLLHIRMRNGLRGLRKYGYVALHAESGGNFFLRIFFSLIFTMNIKNLYIRITWRVILATVCIKVKLQTNFLSTRKGQEAFVLISPSPRTLHSIMLKFYYF